MALAWGALGAAETTNFTADLPAMAVNVIPVSPDTVQWTETGTVAATDRTLSTAPARWAFDGKPHLATTPDATSSSTWYYVLDMGSTGVDFDCAALIGHNFDTLTLTTIDLELSTTSDFTTDAAGGAGAPSVAVSFGLNGSDDRIMEFDLHHTGSVPLRYTGVQYARLKLSRGSAFTPELGELVLGRRRQLNHKPSIPFDDAPLFHNIESTSSAGGVVSQNVFNRRRFGLSASFEVSEDAYVADFRAWFRQLRGPFLWVYEPSSAPDAFHMMMLESQLEMPTDGWIRRVLQVEAVEQGPERFYLDVEVNG